MGGHRGDGGGCTVTRDVTPGGEQAGEDRETRRARERAPGVTRSVEPLLLDPLASTVAAARRHVRLALQELDADELEESAELGVSELVTNALLHARTPFSVGVCVMPSGRVRIGVTDTSGRALRLRRPGTAATTGRGLRLLESVSTAWGVEALPEERGGGKTVWFEPAESMTDAGFAADSWSAEVEGLLEA